MIDENGILEDFGVPAAVVQKPSTLLEGLQQHHNFFLNRSVTQRKDNLSTKDNAPVIPIRPHLYYSRLLRPRERWKLHQVIRQPLYYLSIYRDVASLGTQEG